MEFVAYMAFKKIGSLRINVVCGGQKWGFDECFLSYPHTKSILTYIICPIPFVFFFFFVFFAFLHSVKGGSLLLRLSFSFICLAMVHFSFFIFLFCSTFLGDTCVIRWQYIISSLEQDIEM